VPILGLVVAEDGPIAEYVAVLWHRI